MRIKFIKEYRAFYDFEGSFEASNSYKVGEIKDVNVTSESARWLIDNGFAEEVKESGWWKPQNGEAYYSLNSYGSVSLCTCWKNDHIDRWRYSMGNVFKTEKAAERYCDYQIAVATVRQDEGFMKISRKNDCSSHGYGILRYYLNGSVISEEIDDAVCAGEFYFDTAEHAKASLEKHPDEWKTILDYDWSRE